MDSGFLTVSKTSDYLGIKPSNLYSMVDRKEIPHYQVCRLPQTFGTEGRVE